MSCRDIDDIVLSYVHGILEDLVEESCPEQCFDSDSFLEMIVAYLPQLEGIDVSYQLGRPVRCDTKFMFRRPKCLSG